MTECQGEVKAYKAWRGGAPRDLYVRGPERIVGLCERHHAERKAWIEKAGLAIDGTILAKDGMMFEFLLLDPNGGIEDPGRCVGADYVLLDPDPDGPPFIFLGDPIVLSDDDYERVVQASRDEPLVCIPVAVPEGADVGAHGYVEGVTRKTTLVDGAPRRIIAGVRGKSVTKDPATGTRITTVTLGEFADMPADVKLPATPRGPFPWSRRGLSRARDGEGDAADPAAE